MVTIKGRKNSNKNPPIFSHEFMIQNHADIISCIAMLFIIGLMVQTTSSWAYTFIVLHHNISTTTTNDLTAPIKYTIGWKDACAVFFYLLVVIIMHAMFQEYIFDKISKRLHLSKVKLAKFNESSNLILFYLLSIFWGIDIIIRDNLLLNISSLWMDYPTLLSFSLKFFFIGQLSYWLHFYPELYFQRVKKEDIAQRVIYITIGLFSTFTAYFLNFQRVGIILLVLHYTGDVLLHGARINYFVNHKVNRTRIWFLIANSVYVFVRIVSLVFTVVVFFYGFNQIESSFDYSTGNFNIPIVQYTVLSVLVFFQIYLLHKLVMRQIKRARENITPVQNNKIKPKQKLKKKEGKKSTLSEDDELPEVDQATKKNLKYRSFTKAK